VSALLFAVDTKSLNRQFQFLGRGLRLYEGKEDCVVIVASGAYDDLPMTLFDSIQGPIKDPKTLTEAGGLGVPADEDELPTVTELCSKLEEVRLWRRRVAAVKTLPWVTVDGVCALALRRPGEQRRKSDKAELIIVKLAAWSSKVCVAQHLWHDRSGRPELHLVSGGLLETDTIVQAEAFAEDRTWRPAEPGEVRSWYRRWVADTKPPSPGLLQNLYWHWLWSSRRSMDLQRTASAMVRWHLGEDSSIGELAEQARRERPIPVTHGEAVKRQRLLIARGELQP
jgi:hypothetical protein